MVPLHVMRISVTSTKTESEESFLAKVQPCLSYLSWLKGSFDRNTDSIPFQNSLVSIDGRDVWSLSAVVGISVGRDRGIHLCRLYQAILRLIKLELTDCIVEGETETLKFT